jgi:F0F1-type ATP synthase assembly protein I
MARAYSGILAAVAVSLAITRGLVLGMMPNEILVQSLWFFFLFAFIGYCIGFVAERVVTESLETQYRSEVTALHAKVNSAQSDSLE